MSASGAPSAASQITPQVAPQVTPQITPQAIPLAIMPPPMFNARCTACWVMFGLMLLTVASFWTLDLKWAQFFSADALRKMGKFIGELLNPTFEAVFQIGRAHV